jgi:hypothetical protein
VRERAKRQWPTCLELNLIRIERCSRGLKVDAEGLGCPLRVLENKSYENHVMNHVILCLECLRSSLREC